jgi:hypothetical protein
MKFTKKQMLDRLKKDYKARKAEKSVLEFGLFAPTEHDLNEELASMPAFRSKKK